jgi:hypothetical protein
MTQVITRRRSGPSAVAEVHAARSFGGLTWCAGLGRFGDSEMLSRPLPAQIVGYVLGSTAG